MPESPQTTVIKTLRKQWMRTSLLAFCLLAASLAAVSGMLLYKFFLVPLWCVLPAFVIFLCCLLLFSPSWKITDREIIRFLNAKYPELEESTELLLLPLSSLPLLQRLQVEKTSQVLGNFQKLPSFFYLLGKPALAFCLAGLLVV